VTGSRLPETSVDAADFTAGPTITDSQFVAWYSQLAAEDSDVDGLGDTDCEEEDGGATGGRTYRNRKNSRSRGSTIDPVVAKLLGDQTTGTGVEGGGAVEVLEDQIAKALDKARTLDEWGDALVPSAAWRGITRRQRERLTSLLYTTNGRMLKWVAEALGVERASGAADEFQGGSGESVGDGAGVVEAGGGFDAAALSRRRHSRLANLSNLDVIERVALLGAPRDVAEQARVAIGVETAAAKAAGRATNMGPTTTTISAPAPEAQQQQMREMTLRCRRIEQLLRQSRLGNVRLRTAHAAQADDVVVSVRQLCTALYILSQKEAVVVV
jgi:hypothetical protein